MQYQEEEEAIFISQGGQLVAMGVATLGLDLLQHLRKFGKT
jgi:hypothetical protein